MIISDCLLYCTYSLKAYVEWYTVIKYDRPAPPVDRTIEGGKITSISMDMDAFCDTRLRWHAGMSYEYIKR